MADSRILQFLIEAEDRSKAAIESAQNNVSGMMKQIDALQPVFKRMAISGGIAFGAISVFAAKTISDFADAEASQKMLEHAVIAVTHATQGQLQATMDLADELERKGVLDGDNIKQGLAQLSTFGLSNDAVRGLGGSLADLAINQFGVKASGDQLADSANMIAKALNGQFGVLEKSGIRFTDAQKNMIQFGTEMQKVDAINKGFAQNLKFTNEVALGTTEGQMAKAAVAAGNMSEAIGGSLTPILEKIGKIIVPVIEKITEFIAAHPKIAAGVIIATAAIAGLVFAIGTIGLIIPSIVGGLAILGIEFTSTGIVATGMWAAITGPVGLVIAAIASVIAIGAVLYNYWDEIKSKTMEFWDWLGPYVQGVIRTTVAIATLGLSELVIFFVQNWTQIKNSTIEVFTSISNFLSSLWDGIKIVISTVWGAISTFFSVTWEVIKGIFLIALELIAAAVNFIFESMGINIQSVFQGIGQFFTAFWEDVKTVFSTTLQIISTLWSFTWTGISTFFVTIWNSIKQAVTVALTFISDKFKEYSAPLSLAWSSLWSGLAGTVGGAWDVVKATIKSSINWIIEKVNTVISAINLVAQKGAAAFGASAYQIPNIPMLAEGGIVTKPTLAILGEAGAEAVIPLNKLPNKNEGEKQTIINLTITGNSFFGEDDLLAKVEKQLMGVLKANVKLA